MDVANEQKLSVSECIKPNIFLIYKVQCIQNIHLSVSLHDILQKLVYSVIHKTKLKFL